MRKTIATCIAAVVIGILSFSITSDASQVRYYPEMTLHAGDQVVIPARDLKLRYFTVIVEDGGAATISRVDSKNATDHTESVSSIQASGSEDFDVFIVDWGYYLVSVEDQDARIGDSR